MDKQLGQDGGILARLRRETRVEHERLEHDLPLLRADLSLSDYRSMLEKFYGFYAPYEQQLSRLGSDDWHNFLAARRRAPLLQVDLEMLGVEAEQLPRLGYFPELGTLAEALGSVYVTEGSTLGGQILAKHVQTVLRLAADGPCRFLLGYGCDTGSMWRNTRVWLEGQAALYPAEMVVAGARRTFLAMHEWMCEQPS